MKITVSLEFDSAQEAAAAIARLPAPTGSQDKAPSQSEKPAGKPPKAAPAASEPSVVTAQTVAPTEQKAAVPAPSQSPQAVTPDVPALAVLAEIVTRAVSLDRSGTVALLVSHGAKAPPDGPKASQVPESKRAEAIEAFYKLLSAANARIAAMTD